jgi:hypothetical protein
MVNQLRWQIWPNVIIIVGLMWGALCFSHCSGPGTIERPETDDASVFDAQKELATEPVEHPRETIAEPIPDTSPSPDMLADLVPEQELTERSVIQLGPLDQALAEDEVRAGIISSDSERIIGQEAISQLKDWKIYNSKVAFAIHGLGVSRSWSGSSGHIIDASLVEADGKATQDLLEEVFPILGLIRVIQATDITLIEAGGKGKRAVIRVKATDIGIPIIDSFLRSYKVGGQIEIDYILSPNATHIEIVTRLQGDERFRPLPMGDGVLFGDLTRLFGPFVGWDVTDLVGKDISWLATVGEKTSYLIASTTDGNPLRIPLTQAAVIPVMGNEAQPDEPIGTYRRYLFVGDGRLEHNLQALHKLKPNSGLQLISGQISGLSNPSTAEITVLNDKGIAISQTRPDSQAKFQFQVPPGPYNIRAEAEGYAAVTAQIQTNSAPITLAFAANGSLQIDLKVKKPDGKIGGFEPVRVQITGTISRLIDLIDPQQKIPLPVGKYTITISRGLAYEYIREQIELSANEQKKLPVTLEQAVDLSGYVAADMHLHASPSIDSELPIADRVSALVAEGLHFAAATDHDTWTDYSSTIQRLKLTPWLRTLIGQEVSPAAFHINAFAPSQIPDNERRYFGLEWVIYENGEYSKNLLPTEVFDVLRKRYQTPIIQINHPRRGQALFNFIGYDPKKGVAALKQGSLDQNWDTLEVYNGKGGRQTFIDTIMLDWFSLLNQGFYKTAVANSDSHTAGSRPGMPGTLIASRHQQGDKIDTNEIIDSLKHNRAIVYAGPLIELRTNTNQHGPGMQIKSSAIDLDITVHAPSWIAVSYLKIYANGQLLKQFDIPASKERVRFRQTLNLKPQRDTWYVVVAGDEQSDMAPVYLGIKPISMTNPIYLDIDGNGFQAPGLE